MRILVDGRPLQGATGRRGVGAYVRCLLQGLMRADAGIEVAVLLDRRLGTLDDAPRGPRIAYVSPRRAPGPALLWGRVLGPRWTRRAGADLIHATFLAPPRPPHGVPLVATVHDLIPLHHPARFNRRQRWVFRRSLALAATASRVIAVSHETATRFREAYGIDETRIEVIPPPVDVERYGAVLRPGLSGVGEPYLLHLGGFDPLKGVPDLLLPAFAHVVREKRDLLLALTGSGAGRVDAERVARDLGLTGRVLFVGHLAAEEHVSAIAGASAVVVSSWEEGFGLPAAEALAAGVPLAVGPAAATREAAGRHAALAPAPTPEGLAEAIRTALASGDRVSNEAESRRLFARRFAPERVAARVIDAYRAALSAAPARPAGKTMRLGVDARVLSHRPTGVARYLSALLEEYGRSRRAGEILELFVDRALPVPPPAAALAAGPNITPRAPSGERRVTVLRWPLPGGDPAWRQLRLAAHLLVPPRPDVLFCPFYTVPLLARVPRVVTIHDVSFLAHAEWFTRRARLAFSLVRPSARAARFVVTVSRFSATEIMRRLDVPAQRIAVIPPGIAADWSRPVDADGRADLRQWLGHSGPYLLHLGAVQRRRNVDVVLRAFARLARSHPELKMVIAGPTLDRVPDLARAATELQIKDKILRREWVPEPHLKPLLAEATALIYLSSYEGFGLPALEAMATGAPVVALRRASLPEVLGDAAAFVDEPEAARLAAVIDRLLRDTTWSAELRRLGAERARLFSTRAAAERTFDLLREVAAGR